MTNQMIILMESVKLMEEGILKPTGQTITVKDQEGHDKVLEMPEEIHTYQHWKSIGFQVRKGQKSIAKFPVWKHINGKTETDADGNEVQNSGRMFLKTASFFSRSQVDAVAQ